MFNIFIDKEKLIKENNFLKNKNREILKQLGEVKEELKTLKQSNKKNIDLKVKEQISELDWIKELMDLSKKSWWRIAENPVNLNDIFELLKGISSDTSDLNDIKRFHPYIDGDIPDFVKDRLSYETRRDVSAIKKIVARLEREKERIDRMPKRINELYDSNNELRLENQKLRKIIESKDNEIKEKELLFTNERLANNILEKTLKLKK